MYKLFLPLSIFLLITFYLSLFTPSALASGASLSLSPSTGAFNKGCAFSLEIKLDTGGAQTDGTDTLLFYDSTRFAATGIRSGTIYSDYPGNSIDPQNGKITVSGLSSIASAFAGSGTLAIIDFKVLETAPEGATQVKFDFDPNDKTKTTDSNVVERETAVDILTQVTNGNYTIGTGSCTGATITPAPGGSGGPTDGTVVPTKIPTKPLPDSADFQTTFMLGFAGSILIILGILGLALL